MVRLFMSDRIFIDGSFYNGGIVVNNNGKIEEVFKDRTEVDEWLDSSEHVEVNISKLLLIFYLSRFGYHSISLFSQSDLRLHQLGDNARFGRFACAYKRARTHRMGRV